MNLYDMNDEYIEALNSLSVDENGEVIGMEKVEALEQDIKDKALNYGKAVRMMQAEIELIKKETERLDSMKATLEKKIAWLEGAIGFILPEEGLKDLHVAIKWSSSKAIEVSDESLVPEKYIRTTVKTTSSVDKVAVKSAIEGSEEVPGCSLVTRKKINIK